MHNAASLYFLQTVTCQKLKQTNQQILYMHKIIKLRYNLFAIQQVTYKCVHKTTPCSEGVLLRVCENHSHAIHCHTGTINITLANYGRLDGGHICPGAIHTTNCGASGSRGKVKSSCQGKKYCALQATNGQFGDPCRGTTKYLEVRIIL